MFAGGRDSRRRDHVRVVGARFGGIDGGVYRGNFAEAHLRDGIEEAGINLQALGVDDLRACGNFHVCADGGDFAVANDQRAILDGRAGQREDFCVRESDGGRRLRLRGSVQR